MIKIVLKSYKSHKKTKSYRFCHKILASEKKKGTRVDCEYVLYLYDLSLTLIYTTNSN